MNAPDVKRQPVSSIQKPFATYLVLSIVLHTLFIAGLVASARWLNKPKHYKPVSHIVSLVDAPSTLRQTSQTGQGKASDEKSAARAKRPASRHNRVARRAKKAKPPRATSKRNVKPGKGAQRSNIKKTTRAVTSRNVQNKSKPSASASKPQNTVKPSPPRSKTKRQQATKSSLPSQTPTAEAATDQAQQQAAEQRLTALRSRFGKYGENTTDTTSIEGLQRVRLRAYQELVRRQIVDAWVLPLSQEAAVDLQATALLTIDREGRITQLEILKTSNNPLFDESLIRAIRQAAPLPALPEDYRGTFLELELHFDPGDA